MPSSGTEALIFPHSEIGCDCTDLKLRHGHHHMRKLASDLNVMERNCESVAFGVDSNKWQYGDFCEVKQTAYTKCQRDVENEKLKEWIGTQVVDLEQCQDSGMRTDVDSNKLLCDLVNESDFGEVKQTGYSKHQRDVENEDLKKQARVVDLEQCQDSSIVMDANKVHYDRVKDGDFSDVKRTGRSKCQQDAENADVKRWIGAQVIDLEQCQDSSLRIVASELSQCSIGAFSKTARNIGQKCYVWKLGNQLEDKF